MSSKTSFTAILFACFVISEVCSQESTGTSCKLPAHPKYGIYTITGQADPYGDGFASVNLEIKCNPGFTVLGKITTFCLSGIWADPLPTCSRACKLNPHPSVEYYCVTPNGTRACQEFELGGTVVKPVCKSPDYYHDRFLPAMRCIDGNWDYVAVCLPECGTLPPPDQVEGQEVEFPWHVAVYLRGQRFSPYQTCSGSIISNSIVISNAYCFWIGNSLSLPTSSAVAAGKRHRGWNDANDKNAQQRDVREVRIPSTFQGDPSTSVGNIALVYVTEPFEYNLHVRPICVDFDPVFDSGHLQPGNLATVPVWEREPENAPLNYAFIPFISNEECVNKAYGKPTKITSDKFCIGNDNGVRFCERNAGTSVAYRECNRGVTRFFLRGVVSSVIINDLYCNATLIAVTQLSQYEAFLRSLI